MCKLHALLTAGLMVAVCLAGANRAGADEAPWPSPVDGWQPHPEGVHPGLFFHPDELPRLRQRAETPDGQAVLDELRRSLNGDDGRSLPPLSHFTNFHAAGYGMLWQLTGDPLYAQLGRQCVQLMLDGQRDRDTRYSFRNPDGALRAGPSLGAMGMAFDLLADSWDDAFRYHVRHEIEFYNEGSWRSLEELARGARHGPHSNHWGMQIGGAALAMLAIRNDPGLADPARLDHLLAQNRDAMVRNMTEGFGNMGFFAEGDGTGVMASFISFLPAIQAWEVAGGKDFVTPRENASWLSMRWVLLTIPRNGVPDFHARGGYPQNVWSNSGYSGPGVFSSGFATVLPEHRPGLLWLYNRVQPHVGPYESASDLPHRPMLSFINWPFDIEEQDPAFGISRSASDDRYGFYAFRNRFQDENDVLITLLTRNFRWGTADERMSVWAHGKKLEWGTLQGATREWTPAGDGSGILTMTDGTSLAVDMSGASGTDAMLVMTGPGAPTSGRRVNVGGTWLSFLFLHEEAAPDVTVEGNVAIIGDQRVWVENGSLVLEKMAEPWEPAVLSGRLYYDQRTGEVSLLNPNGRIAAYRLLADGLLQAEQGAGLLLPNGRGMFGPDEISELAIASLGAQGLLELGAILPAWLTAEDLSLLLNATYSPAPNAAYLPLAVHVIPEPATAMLLGLGAMLPWFRRRA